MPIGYTIAENAMYIMLTRKEIITPMMRPAFTSGHVRARVRIITALMRFSFARAESFTRFTSETGNNDAVRREYALVLAVAASAYMTDDMRTIAGWCPADAERFSRGISRA